MVVMQYDGNKIGFLEASNKKLSEIESMAKYLNDLITKHISFPSGALASPASRESISDSHKFR